MTPNREGFSAEIRFATAQPLCFLSSRLCLLLIADLVGPVLQKLRRRDRRADERIKDAGALCIMAGILFVDEGQRLIEVLDQLGSDNVVLQRGISLFDAVAEGVLRAAAGR